jgi:hypothetical protein
MLVNDGWMQILFYKSKAFHYFIYNNIAIFIEFVN